MKILLTILSLTFCFVCKAQSVDTAFLISKGWIPPNPKSNKITNCWVICQLSQYQIEMIKIAVADEGYFADDDKHFLIDRLEYNLKQDYKCIYKDTLIRK